jgi:hypothetical protein
MWSLYSHCSCCLAHSTQRKTQLVLGKTSFLNSLEVLLLEGNFGSGVAEGLETALVENTLASQILSEQMYMLALVDKQI